jgi:hypothetical protein
MQYPSSPNVILCKNRKINLKNYTEIQKTPNSKSNPQQKRAMLEVSQHQTSNYTTGP